MCIFCFLDKQNQKVLRKKAEALSNSYEQSLDIYKKIYIEDYKKELNKNICIEYTRLKAQKDCIKEIDINKIEKVFDVFKDVYISWINNNTSNSKEKVLNFFKENNLLEEIDLNNVLMFRARKSEEELKSIDMLHIPFTKRFLIKNQRYSLSGRPMLYLGFTPKYIFKEINCNYENSVYISGFYLKEDCHLKVFDFRYNLSFLINDELNPIFNKQEKETLNKNNFEVEIIRSIAASICSFEKKGEYFSEEYVLPQIISEVISDEKYDGLLYTSSKTVESSKISPFIDANLVLFTKYDKNRIYDPLYAYDNDIIQKMFITNPVNILDFKGEKYNTFFDMREIKDRLTEFIMEIPGSMLKEAILNVETKHYAEETLEKEIFFLIIYEILLKYEKGRIELYGKNKDL